MRPLSEDETRVFFAKLAKYLGRNIRHLIERKDEPHCFRLHRDKVYYLSERLVRVAANCSRENLMAMGTAFGKFTRTGKFKLHMTCLDLLAHYAKFKLWIKPSGEMSYLYGKNVVKAHLGRITENTPRYQGVVVFSMSGIPLGFGVTAYSTQEMRKVDPTIAVCFHQADVGEYLRDEDTLM